MATVIALTDIERAYLERSSSLAAASPSWMPGGAPQNSPLGEFLDEERGDIVIGGYAMGGTRKFRNVRSNPRVVWSSTTSSRRTRGPCGASKSAVPPWRSPTSTLGPVHEPGDHPDHTDVGRLLGPWTPTLRTRDPAGS